MTGVAAATPPAVAVVILNYNGGARLLEVVRAVAASEGVRVGLVVVDNHSSDGSMAALRVDARTASTPDAPSVLLLDAGANLGYAGGNNLGLFGLEARYLVLLNNDALVERGTLAALVAFMDRYPRVGACAPRLTWPDGRPQAFSHGGDPTPLYLARRGLARRAKRDLHAWGPGAPRPVDWVAGTCMVLRPAALACVGLLDERIFMYFEDNDLCLRLRRAGWDVYLVPEVAVRHFNQPSYADRQRVARYNRALAYFYRKHYGAVPAAIVAALGWLRTHVRS